MEEARSQMPDGRRPAFALERMKLNALHPYGLLPNATRMSGRRELRWRHDQSRLERWPAYNEPEMRYSSCVPLNLASILSILCQPRLVEPAPVSIRKAVKFGLKSQARTDGRWHSAISTGTIGGL